LPGGSHFIPPGFPGVLPGVYCIFRPPPPPPPPPTDRELSPQVGVSAWGPNLNMYRDPRCARLAEQPFAELCLLRPLCAVRVTFL
jgi:hypothetical protein